MSQPIMQSPRNKAGEICALESDRFAISRRNAIKALFGAAAAATLFASPMRAFATPSATKETTDALAAAQKKFEEAQQQLDDLSDQFQTLSEKLDDTIGQIEDVNGQIDDTQELIEEKQEELEEKQGELAHRVSSSYKAGDNRMLALLLSSESFSDLLSKTYYINKVNESDQRAIEEVVQIQEDLKETKAELESQKVELEGLKEQQTAQLQSMKDKKDEVQALLDG